MTNTMHRMACASRTLAAFVLASAGTLGTLRAEPIAGWPQPDGPNSPVTITYSYSNLLDGSLLLLSAHEIRAATEESLALWARYAPLHFIEVPDAGPPPSDIPYDGTGDPRIRIGQHPMPDIAHAFFPDDPSGLGGDVHLDTEIPWTLGAGRWNILEALVHELGHALGLPHELDRPAIMNPSFPQQLYGGLGSTFLFPADIESIQAIYGSGAGRLEAINPTPEPGAIALVATGLVSAAGTSLAQRLNRVGRLRRRQRSSERIRA